MDYRVNVLHPAQHGHRRVESDGWLNVIAGSNSVVPQFTSTEMQWDVTKRLNVYALRVVSPLSVYHISRN